MYQGQRIAILIHESSVTVECKSVVDEEAEADLVEVVVQKIHEDREKQKKAKVEQKMVIAAATTEEVDKKPAVPDPSAALDISKKHFQVVEAFVLCERC